MKIFAFNQEEPAARSLVEFYEKISGL